MLVYEITASSPPTRLTPALVAAGVPHGLHIALSTELKTYPGSRHWHLRRADLPGVLEVTYWPKRNRLWVSVRANRDGGWARQACPLFARALAAQIAGRAKKSR